MKTIKSDRTLQESGPFTSYEFGIRKEDLSHIFGVLRNQMYSDKILAVIREYSTNAYDAHVEAGIKDTPIRVTLPNTFFPEFKVRDFGNGLSEDDIQRVYAFYGCSTKRESNDMVGQLGFGSKSAFAYGDNFVITSYHKGIKTVYNAVIDPSQIGKISRLHQEAMQPTDRTGVEITIPINSSDFNTFESKARTFYAYWDVIPEISGIDPSTINNKSEVVLAKNDWRILSNGNNMGSRVFAIMGNVTYPMNVQVIREKHNDNCIVLIEKFLSQNSNTLLVKFNIGDLEISSSRESLQYSEHTYKNILSKLNNVVEHIKKAIAEEFEKMPTLWDAKVLFNDYFCEYGSKFYGLTIGQNGLKISWRGIPIISNTFTDMRNWCNNNGHMSSKDYVNLTGKGSGNYSGVLSTAIYKYSGWRIRHHRVDLIASRNSIVVLNDIPKVSMLNKCIIKVLANNSKSVHTVYILKFTKEGLYDEFVKHNNFSTVPVYKLSDVFQSVKDENRRSRKAASELSTVKYVELNGQRYYRRDPWNEGHVDILNSGGFYVDIEFNTPQYRSRCYNVDDIKSVMVHLNTHFNTKIDTTGKLYGMNKKNRESSSFKKNKLQWHNIFELVEHHVNKIRADESYNKYVAYRKVIEHSTIIPFSVPIYYARKIYDKLNNKNTQFAILMKELDDRFTDKGFENTDYLETMIHLHSSDAGNPKVTEYYNEYRNIFNTVTTTYKMLNHLSFIRSWHGVENNSEFCNIIADYINLVDKNTIVK